MALWMKRQEGKLLWGVWRMDEMPEAGKRVQEREAVLRLLCELCGAPQTVLHQSNGKPYLADGGWHVSISHTKGYAAVALHPDCEVGIDIEQYTERVCRLRTKYLSADELAETDADNMRQLLVYWCAKETVYKALGIDGTELRSHIRVLPFVLDVAEGHFSAVELKTGTRKEFPLKYLLDKDFVLTYTLIR